MSGTDYTVTPNLALFKPIPDKDVGNWGTHWNVNADTLDGLFPGGNGLSSYLRLSGGTMTGALNYTATGGSVTRSAQNRAADTINVKDYGAVGNGTTDDGAAIRAAIATGGAIYFPPGTYLFTGGYFVLPGNTRIYGAGSTKSIIKPQSLSNPDGTRAVFVNRLRDNPGLAASPPAIPVNQTDASISISGLGFDLSLCNTPSTSVALMSFLLARNISIVDIRADNYSASSAKGWSGVQFVGCDNCMIDGFFGRNCVNAVDNWKGSTRIHLANLSIETADAAGNGGAINFNAIGTTRADFGTADDLEITNATIWLNNNSIALFLDGLGAGSTSQNILLRNITISARSGTTGNLGLVFRGKTNRLKASGLSFTAVSGADMRPIWLDGYYDGTPAVTGANLITTTAGSNQITASYPGGANSGPGNFMAISDGAGGSVVGNGLSLNDYYLITAVSGPVTGISSGNSFTITVPNNATASGTLSGTTRLLGYWGTAASCELSGITIDGCSAFGLDLITLNGTGHQLSGVVVSTNYGASSTPQYRSVISVDTTGVKGTAAIGSSVGGIVGAAGTGALSAGFSGDNTVTWRGVRPFTSYSGISYSGTSSADHYTATTDVTIGTGTANYIIIQGRDTGFPPRILAQGSDTNVSLGLHWQGTGNIQFQDSGGTTRHTFDTGTSQLALSSLGIAAFRAVGIANQVNVVTASGGITGNPALLYASSSSDTNVSLGLHWQGAGNVQIQDSGGTVRHIFDNTSVLAIASTGGSAFRAVGIANQVNVVTASGGIAGNPALLSASASSDTNVAIQLDGKGNKGILFSASSGPGVPTTTDIPASHAAVWKNTTDASARLYYNDAGTLKSVVLT
jgi:hypothetical protein